MMIGTDAGRNSFERNAVDPILLLNKRIVLKHIEMDHLPRQTIVQDKYFRISNSTYESIMISTRT